MNTIRHKLHNILLPAPKNQQQLLAILHKAYQHKILGNDVLSMLEGVLDVSEMQVRDLMVPRPQMVVIEINSSLQEILPIVIESGHSRFPVIGESRDEVIGLLLAKDLLPYAIQEKPFNIQHILRPTLFVPESKRLNILLREFRIKHNHLAIVVDEYGGVAGLITIEDVLEQIVGEIEDEYDTNEEPHIKNLYENNFTVKALTPIEDFNKVFHTNFSDEKVDTIGGIVTQQFGHVPKKGENIFIGNLQFKVLLADSRRIRLLAVQIIK